MLISIYTNMHMLFVIFIYCVLHVHAYIFYKYFIEPVFDPHLVSTHENFSVFCDLLSHTPNFALSVQSSAISTQLNCYHNDWIIYHAVIWPNICLHMHQNLFVNVMWAYTECPPKKLEQILCNLPSKSVASFGLIGWNLLKITIPKFLNLVG